MAKLSEIFDRAADLYLARDVRSAGYLKREFSCDAVSDAAGWGGYDDRRARVFLAEAGVQTQSLYEFEGVKNKQAVRYAWLKLCAQVAREEGL